MRLRERMICVGRDGPAHAILAISPSQSRMGTAQKLEETLGHVRTEPRDLTEYDRLPTSFAARSRTPETNS